MRKRDLVSLVRKSTFQLLARDFRSSTSPQGFERTTVEREESLDEQMTKISIIETVSQDSELSIRPELISRKTQRKLQKTEVIHARKLESTERSDRVNQKGEKQSLSRVQPIAFDPTHFSTSRSL